MRAATVEPKEIPDGTMKSSPISDAILDQLLAGADPKTALKADGLPNELKKAQAELALNADMDHHLAGEAAGNTRSGYGRNWAVGTSI